MLAGFTVFILGSVLLTIGQCCISSKSPVQSLFEAASENDKEALTTFLLKGEDVDSIDNGTGKTALMSAAENGFIEIVTTLLAHNASVDIPNKKRRRDDEGKTALMYASGNSKYHGNKVVIALLDKMDRMGLTALRTAAYEGHNEIVSTLLAHNASVDKQNRFEMTALMYAAENGLNAVVSTLLANNASVDIQDRYKETALMKAARHGRIGVVLTLLAHNASVDVQSEIGLTALMFAAEQGHNEVASSLLAHNGSADLQDSYGRTALCFAAEYGHMEVISTLLESGASVDIHHKQQESN